MQPGLTLIELFEQYVNKVLSRARAHAGVAAKESLTEMNSVKAMVTSGSKRSFINISQIIECVGQQNVEGKRIPYGLSAGLCHTFLKTICVQKSRLC